MKSRNIFIASTAAVMAVSSVAAPMEASTGLAFFTDVKKENALYPEIADLFAQGKINGYKDGTFRPNESVTRGQAAVMIAAILELDTSSPKNVNLKDIKKEQWYFGSISAIVEHGIMGGYKDGTFRPDLFLTRGEASRLISEAFSLSTGGEATHFKDVKKDAWYYSYIQALVANEVTFGKSANTFAPGDVLTRGELVAFASRADKANATKVIDSLGKDGVVLSGKTYKVADNLKPLFVSSNNAALKGATIQFKAKDGVIESVASLTLKSDGKQNAPVVLDGGNAKVSGNVVVSGDYNEVKNLTITGNLSIQENAKISFKGKNIEVRGTTSVNEGQVRTAVLPTDMVVILEDSKLNDVQAAKKNAAFAFEGSTSVGEMTIQQNAKVSASAHTKLSKVSISDSVSEVELNALIESVYITGKSALALKGSGNISQATVNSTGKIFLGNQIKIKNIVLPEGSTLQETFSNYEEIKGNIGSVNGAELPAPPPSFFPSPPPVTPPLLPPPIVDTIKPLITLIGYSQITVEYKGSFTDPGVQITDNIDKNLAPIKTITKNGVTVERIDTSVSGSYLIHYNVKDSAGNAATEAVRTVIVQEDTDTAAINWVKSAIEQMTFADMSSVKANVPDVFYQAGTTIKWSVVDSSNKTIPGVTVENGKVMVDNSKAAVHVTGAKLVARITKGVGTPATATLTFNIHVEKAVIADISFDQVEPVGLTENYGLLEFTVKGKLTESLATENFKYQTEQNGQSVYLSPGYTKVNAGSYLYKGEYSYTENGPNTVITLKLNNKDAEAIESLNGYGNDYANLEESQDQLVSESGWYLNAAAGSKPVTMNNSITISNYSSKTIDSIHLFDQNNREIQVLEKHLEFFQSFDMKVTTEATKMVFYSGDYVQGVTPTSGEMKAIPVIGATAYGADVNDAGWVEVNENNFGKGPVTGLPQGGYMQFKYNQDPIVYLGENEIVFEPVMTITGLYENPIHGEITKGTFSLKTPEDAAVNQDYTFDSSTGKLVILEESMVTGTYTLTYKNKANSEVVISRNIEVKLSPYPFNYEIKGLVGDYYQGKLLTEAPKGNPNDIPAFNGLAPIVMNITKNEQGVAFTGNAKLKAFEHEGIQLWAQDHTGKWFDMNQNGPDGVDGFNIDQDSQTIRLYFLSDEKVQMENDYFLLSLNLIDTQTGDLLRGWSFRTQISNGVLGNVTVKSSTHHPKPGEQFHIELTNATDAQGILLNGSQRYFIYLSGIGNRIMAEDMINFVNGKATITTNILESDGQGEGVLSLSLLSLNRTKYINVSVGE